MPGLLKVKVGGVWQDVSYAGPTGPQGPPGPTGVATIIVGNFGQSKTPADLPPDGAIPVDWDAVGNPAHQMVIGESLIYLPTDIADPLHGHLYQFMAPGWVDVGQIVGPPGPVGPLGSTGAPGADGADGAVGPAGPAGGPVPVGGVLDEMIVKTGPADFEVGWTVQRPRIALRAQATQATGGAVNVMATLTSGTVTIDPTRWYHIFAGVRCIQDPGVGGGAQFRVVIGTVQLNGYDVVETTDPNAIWGSWSQSWLEPGNVLLAAGGDVVAKLDGMCSTATRLFYTPRLFIVEY